MRKRFSDLERVYDAINLANVTISSLPQGLDFVKYANWRQGNVPVREITRPALNGEVQVGVQAFGLVGTDPTGKIIVTMTGRSKTALDGIAGLAPKLGYTSTLTDYSVNGSFSPAQIRVGVRQTGTAATSRITGRRYKKKTSAAYTGVLGQTAGAGAHFQGAINGVLALAAFTATPPALPTHTASFTPERFYRG